jgi:hypothetical protein
MRIYLELIEISEEEGDFIRVDVTDWDNGDVEEAISLLKQQAQSYTSYVLQKHYCMHEEGGSCTSVLISQK